MGIISNKVNCKIIDRSLINIYNQEINKELLGSFLRNLEILGVDYFEVDEKVIQFTEHIIESNKLLMRINSYKDIELSRKIGVTFIIVEYEQLEHIEINCSEFKVILEINVEKMNIMNLKLVMNEINFYAVRLKGIKSYFSEYLYVETLNLKMDVYASDALYMATAVAFQGLSMGFEYITTSFCGKDGEFGTTPLEEILTLAMVVDGRELTGKLSILSEMKVQYEKITYNKIPGNKPIIGSNIFKYESGVHVSGINKNPITYEPFSPDLVGLKRKMALGKHSSRNSIKLKIKELGISNRFSESEIESILLEVKRQSIANKMELLDNEFLEICKASESK